jgi:hypothetical protein
MSGETVSGTPPPAAPAGAARPGPTGAAPRLGRRNVLIAFGVVLGTFLLVAAISAFLADPVDPPPDCAPGTECGGPPPGAGVGEPTSVPTTNVSSAPLVPPDTVGIRAGKLRTDTELGYEFEYSGWWAPDEENTSTHEAFFDLNPAQDPTRTYRAQLIVSVTPSSESGTQAWADKWLNNLRAFAPDLQPDEIDKNAILGPEIGFVNGTGQTFAGSTTNAQGQTAPIGVSLVTASDGRNTAAVILIVWDPEKSAGEKWVQYSVRARTEIVLKTFRWGPLQ